MRCRRRLRLPGPEAVVGFLEKVKNRSQVSRGRAKQRAGRMTNNRRMQAEGLADRLSGSAKQIGERAKDVAKDVRRAFHR
jgi:uncharacterized protein YjbJ (UPF0337 family)